jgi:Family of unknown function (DUF6114)
MTASDDGGGPAGPPPWELTGQAAGPATHRLTAARGGGRRRTWRTWRRSRPFWGGLLLILAGLEMLAIPLLSVLVHTSVKVIIYIGIGGVFGVLIGGLLVACGLLIWFHPNQRVFYAVAGVLLAVVSFVATNLGGFFLGMLLGVTGGSLSFAWAPLTARGGPAADDAQPGGAPAGDTARGDAARGGHRGSGGRLTALAATPLVLSGLMLPGYLGRAAQPAAAQAGCIIYIPIICPPPSPAPSPSASATPSATAPPTTGPPTTGPPTTGQPTTPAAPALAPSAAGTPEPGASGTPTPSASATAQPKAAAPGPRAAAAQSSLTADSALLEGLAYDGVAQVPTADGTVTMMKFTMSSLTLTGDIALTVTEAGGTDVTRGASMHFGGPVVLYATKLSGDLLGIPVTITPASPLATVLQVLAPLTQAVPVPMTNVVTDQPYTTAGSLQASALQIGA